jgi:hypothetical protein
MLHPLLTKELLKVFQGAKRFSDRTTAHAEA